MKTSIERNLVEILKGHISEKLIKIKDETKTIVIIFKY